MRRGWLCWFWVFALGLVLGGCGDSNVFEGIADDSGGSAQEEEALAALNDGDFSQAVALFTDLYRDDPSPEVARYLAAAYVGLAGFDTLELIDKISEAEESGEDSETVLYQSVTELFDSDGDGQITADELGEKREDLEWALYYLLEATGAGGEPPALAKTTRPELDDSLAVQLGLYSAIDSVLGIVGQLRVDPSDPESPLYLSLEELADHPEVIDAMVAPAGLDEDLARVSAAVDVLADQTGSDLESEFEAFLTDIQYLGGLTPEHVTDEELQDYLHTLVDPLSDEVQP